MLAVRTYIWSVSSIHCCWFQFPVYFQRVCNVIFFQDIDFFQHLELHLRSELPSLVGRDHLSFRSYYLPMKVCSL